LKAFLIAVEEAIIAGFLKSGDILVMDNAAIHVFGENDVLIDFLWEHFRIHILMLPTRSPELNHIELLWNILVQHLKSINLHPSRYMQHRVAYQAAEIINRFTHSDVAKCYQCCSYVV
jgi:transposase